MYSESSLKFVTYNIDGLNPTALSYRTNALLSFIISENADIIQLQEVVAETAPVLIKALIKCGFTSFHEADRPSDLCHYFTLSFARSDKIRNPVIRRVAYTGAARSEQGRDLLQLSLTYMNTRWTFINCHLESCGVAFKSAGSTIRQAQLREGLEIIRTHPGPAILAGDLNIRDPEAVKVMQDYSTTLLDASIVLEKGKKSNTWFMPGPSSYSARYDRVYSNKNNKLTPTTIKIIGGEDIFEGTGLYDLPYNTPSDHRGLVVTYTFEPSPAAEVGSNCGSGVGLRFAAGGQQSLNNPVPGAAFLQYLQSLSQPATAATASNSATSTSTSIAGVSRLTSKDVTTVNNSKKRSLSAIPSDAEIITLDDSDASDTEQQPSKRTNKSQCRTSAKVGDSGGGGGGDDGKDSISDKGHDGGAPLSAQDRRKLFLEAMEKRNLT